MRARRTEWITWCLVLLGLAFCWILTARALALAAGDMTGSFDICSAVFPTNCDATLADEASVVLGIPLAGWGLVYYAALLVLLGMAATPGGAFTPAVQLAALLLGLAGAAIGLALAGVILLGPVAPCPLCFCVHAVALVLVLPLWKRCGLTISQATARVRSALGLAVGKRGARGPGTAATVVAFLCALLAAVVVYQKVDLEWLLARSRKKPRPLDFEAVLQAWRDEPRVDIPLRDDDPRLGEKDAPAQIVVFSSLQCRGCAQLARFLSGLHRRAGGRASIIFKHFPLGTACNPNVDGDYHPHACAAALAAEAARLQDRFWVFHDALFAVSLVEGAGTLVEVARALGLDEVHFERDRTSPEAAARVRTDIDLGHRLGVEGTPSIFLNGRRIHDLRSAAVERLITRACFLGGD